MAKACNTSNPTATSIMTSEDGAVISPKAMIRVVAPAGACGALASTIPAPVAASARLAAIIRGHVMALSTISGVLARPVTTSAKYPQTMPIAWPIMTLLGFAALDRGDVKSNMAVGPSDGNTNAQRVK